TTWPLTDVAHLPSWANTGSGRPVRPTSPTRAARRSALESFRMVLLTSVRPGARPVLQDRPVGHLGVNHQEITTRLDLFVREALLRADERAGVRVRLGVGREVHRHDALERQEALRVGDPA